MIIINKVLWYIATILLVSTGIYFTIKLNLVQFKIKKIIKCILKKEKKEGISSYETLMMVLAGRIGVGSIAGVALAIHLGGIGSIFWMWIIAIISASTSFIETILGIIYKEKDGFYYKGGPSYYLKNGLNKKLLGSIYAILILFSYTGGFLSIQSNTITKSINQITYVSPIIIGVIISIVTLIIIFGGIKRIAFISSTLVPFMIIVYLLITLCCCLNNIKMIPNIFFNIVKGAFNIKSFFSSFIPTLIVGIQRGIFSNEAGLGTGSIASSTTNSNDYIKQGFIQMIGIYITTLLICTSTALIILTSDYKTLNISDVNGIEITQYAFKYHLGNVGNYLIFILIILFSFTTILTGYYNGESSLKYLIKNIKNIHLIILKIITIIVLFIGCLIKSSSIWLFVDILVACEAIINIYALIKLRKDVERVKL